MSFNKARLEKVLEKYNYFIYEITTLDKTKTIYIANKDTKRVEHAYTGRSWQEINEVVFFDLLMYERI